MKKYFIAQKIKKRNLLKFDLGRWMDFDGVHMHCKNKKGCDLDQNAYGMSLSHSSIHSYQWLDPQQQHNKKKLVTLMYAYISRNDDDDDENGKSFIFISFIFFSCAFHSNAIFLFIFIQNILQRIPKSFFSLHELWFFFLRFSYACCCLFCVSSGRWRHLGWK